MNQMWEWYWLFNCLQTVHWAMKEKTIYSQKIAKT